jgi:glucan biosynthesis protein C
VLAVAFTACGWLTAIGAVRLSLRPCAAPPRFVRYLAQASFWMYLFHHPAVGLAQVAVHGSGLNAETKFALVWISATGLSLLTYEVCVRRTWVGALLNGQRETARPSLVETQAPQRRAA